MPKIKWLNLPAPLREHLFDRAKERKVAMERSVRVGGMAKAFSGRSGRPLV
jgi:hypothetical protein